MFGLFPFDPVHVRVFALEDFLFPFLHPIEKHLQAHGVDGTVLVEIPTWTTVKKNSVYPTYRC